jgi:ATP-binding cassette, subfamily B, bacterial
VLRRSVREARRQRGRLAGELGEKLLAARSVRHLGQTRVELRRVRRRSERLRDALVRRASTAEAVRALPDLVTPAGIALWIFVAGTGRTDELAAGILLLSVLGSALRDLARALDRRLNFDEGRRRIAALLDAHRLEENPHPRVLPGSGPLSLQLEGVCIEGLLRDVALHADAGDCVLVTGAAGQGKSTLLALAARLLDPSGGELRLDGHPLRSLALDSLHDAVQLVSPELPLMRGSVAQNLSYGLPDDDDDGGWLAEVAFACGLTHEPALTEGLATRVEERGQNLSAGLRARVSLARALAMRPRLLLVDEPAFALDDQAANALRRALALHPTTTLVVAPETSELLSFDRVWILAGGRVAERRPATMIRKLEPAAARP